MNTQKAVAITVITGILNWFIFYGIFQIIPIYWESSIISPQAVATILMVTILGHEIGHKMAYKKYDIKCFIIFLVFKAGVSVWPQDEEKKNNLSNRKDMWVSLAGILAQIIMVGISIPLLLLEIIEPSWFWFFMHINGALILWNLIPWSDLDGAKFIKHLFKHIPEEGLAKKYRTASMMAIILPAILLITISNMEGVLFVIIISYLMWRFFGKRISETYPKTETEIEPILPKQLNRLKYTYILCLLFGVVFMVGPLI